jgi:hypothetical protein
LSELYTKHLKTSKRTILKETMERTAEPNNQFAFKKQKKPQRTKTETSLVLNLKKGRIQIELAHTDEPLLKKIKSKGRNSSKKGKATLCCPASHRCNRREGWTKAPLLAGSFSEQTRA